MKARKLLTLVASLALGAGVAAPSLAADPQQTKLLNVSYDPTRELYEEINRLFAEQYKQQTGKDITVEQSHGGSSKQARSVIDGLKADVVTLGLGWDVIAIERAGLIKPGWQARLPDNAAPYTSTVAFLVRKGNPKNIKDWNDLVRQDVKVIASNPKTSGGGRWAFLGAWGYAAGASTYDLSKPEGLRQAVSDARAAKDFPALKIEKARAFIASLYKNVPVLDTGARGSTVTFAQRGVGDVLINWENELWLAREEFGADQFEIVYPSVSILGEPPVAVVDKFVDERGTREVAE